MIQSKRRYQTKGLALLMHWNSQFLLGFVVVILGVGSLVWQTPWQTWVNSPPRVNSLIATAAVYCLSQISLRKFFNYLGFISLRYIIPVVLVWATVSYGLLFFFRLHYSVYYLAYSTAFMLLFFLSFGYIRNHYGRFSIAYIPLGNLADKAYLPRLKTIEWHVLAQPTENPDFFIDAIVADLRANLGRQWEQFLATTTLKHIPVYHSSRFIEAVSGRVRIDHLYENELGSLLPSKSYLFIKRLLDILMVLASLPLVLPVMLTTALLIKLESRGSIFFTQERIGQGGELFTMYKFRSMYVDTANNETTGDNDQRITRVGKWIRKFRIDELPQFYNVIRGQMSLIGPRAEFHQFAEAYKKEIPFYEYRHIVKPGISGWAQVEQGYNFGVNETRTKLEYDFYYIKNLSFSMDLLILFKTIQTIITGFGSR